MHSETFIAKLTEVQQTVQQLLADLQRSERGQFAVVTSTALAAGTLRERERVGNRQQPQHA